MGSNEDILEPYKMSTWFVKNKETKKATKLKYLYLYPYLYLYLILGAPQSETGVKSGCVFLCAI